MTIKNNGTIHINVHSGNPPGPRFAINRHPITEELTSAILTAFSGKPAQHTQAGEKRQEPATNQKEQPLNPIPSDGRPITERVSCYADIEAISGKRIIRREGETDDEMAQRQCKLIAEVYNEGVVLDARNTNQRKYFPWAKIDPTSGSGLSFSDFGNWHSHSSVGVRLCFGKSEHAKDAFLKCTEIYANLLIN